MSLPATPQNLLVQQGNGTVLVSFSAVLNATGYVINRSLDAATWTTLATVTTVSYIDTTVTLGTTYYYQVAATNGTGTSAFTIAQSVTPVESGMMTLAELRQHALERADRVNTTFITTPELNSYINQSYFELYDLLIDTYEDYYAKSMQFQTNGSDFNYALPQDFYKLLGVDCGLDQSSNAWVTLKKFDFIARNRFVYPQITSTFLGVFNLQYRLMANNLMFIPTPSAGQFIRMWYIPRLDTLLQDSDAADGVSGWTEYIIVDAAIKILQKEESDVSVLMAQKEALRQRIEASSMNRDAGQPDTITDARTWSERWGGYGGGWDGGTAGW